MNWKRKEMTTRGSDPTVVVSWSVNELTAPDIEIIEFQGVIMTQLDGVTESKGSVVDILGESLHEALEAAHELEHGTFREGNEDAKIYGGE